MCGEGTNIVPLIFSRLEDNGIEDHGRNAVRVARRKRFHLNRWTEFMLINKDEHDAIPAKSLAACFLFLTLDCADFDRLLRTQGNASLNGKAGDLSQGVF